MLRASRPKGSTGQGSDCHVCRAEQGRTRKWILVRKDRSGCSKNTLSNCSQKGVCVCVHMCIYIYITIRYYNGSKFDAWATLHSSCDVSFDLSSLNHCLSTKPSPLGHTPRRKPPSCCGSFGWGLVLQEPCAAAPVRDFKFTFQLLITDLHVGLKWQTSSFGCQTPFSLPK